MNDGSSKRESKVLILRMENTGERHILQQEFNNEAEFYNHTMHIATYNYALGLVKGKKVLDYGSGSGYGAYILSKEAKSVIGADISQEAVEYSNKEYVQGNLNFKHIADLSNEKFDVITSFQVIEHVSNDEKYLRDLKKLLLPGGSLIISTPDKKDRLFNYIQKPWNIFHLKEYTGKSLGHLLTKYFNDVTVLKIGSESDFIHYEIARTKKQRLITLPCSLSIYPNFIRVFLLTLQAKLYRVVSSVRNKQKIESNTNKVTSAVEYTLKQEEILFKKEIEFSTDLLVISKNTLKSK